MGEFFQHDEEVKALLEVAEVQKLLKKMGSCLNSEGSHIKDMEIKQMYVSLKSIQKSLSNVIQDFLKVKLDSIEEYRIEEWQSGSR